MNVWEMIKTEIMEEVALITLNVSGDLACITKILDKIAQESINVDMICQTPPKNDYIDFSFTIMEGDMRQALGIVGDISKQQGGIRTSVSGGMTKIKFFGDIMRTTPGVASKIFQRLCEEKEDIILVTTSETSVSVLCRKGEKLHNF